MVHGCDVSSAVADRLDQINLLRERRRLLVRLGEQRLELRLGLRHALVHRLDELQVLPVVRYSLFVRRVGLIRQRGGSLFHRGERGVVCLLRGYRRLVHARQSGLVLLANLR